MKTAFVTTLLFTSFFVFFFFVLSPVRLLNSIDQSRYLYVSHITGTTVTVIDKELNKVVDTIQAGNGPVWVAQKPGGEILYIANFNSNDVTVYDKTFGEVKATVPAGSNPSFVTASPDGKHVLISHQSSDGMWILNTETNTIERKLDRGTGMMCYCESGKRIFQAQIFTPYVYVYNGSTFATEQEILVGGRPMGLAFSPDEKFAYVPNFDLNEIEKLDVKTGMISSRIKEVKGPRGIAVTPDGKFAYVTNVVENTVSVIDLSSEKIITIIPVGQMPTAVVIPSDGKFAYVSDQGGSFIIVLSLETNEIFTAIPVASNPISIVGY